MPNIRDEHKRRLAAGLGRWLLLWSVELATIVFLIQSSTLSRLGADGFLALFLVTSTLLGVSYIQVLEESVSSGIHRDSRAQFGILGGVARIFDTLSRGLSLHSYTAEMLHAGKSERQIKILTVLYLRLGIRFDGKTRSDYSVVTDSEILDICEGIARDTASLCVREASRITTDPVKLERVRLAGLWVEPDPPADLLKNISSN